MDEVRDIPQNRVSNKSILSKFKFKGFKDRSPKFYIRLGILSALTMFIIIITLWARQGMETLRNANTFKKSHTLVQEQIKFCQSPKIKEGEDPTVIVHYCDQYKKRFESVKSDNTNK